MLRNSTRFLLLSTASAFLLAQNKIDPSEVRARSFPYLPPSQYTLQVETKLVEVAVVVRDGKGNTVAGLNKDDFEIRDSGKKREVKAFTIQKAVPVVGPSTDPQPSQVAPASPQPAPVVRPRFVGLVFDDLNSNFPEFRQAQVAATHFIKEGLSAGDRIAIFSTYGNVVLQFTSDIPQILAAINKMRPRNMTVDGGMCPQMTPYDAYVIATDKDRTALEVKVAELKRCNPSLDTPTGRRGSTNSTAQISMTDPATRMVISQAHSTWQQVNAISRNTLNAMKGIVDQVARQPGSKMLLLASGGFLTGELRQEQDYVVEHALRQGVVINSLDAKGLYTLDPIEMPNGGDIRSVIYAQGLGTQPKEARNDALAYFAYSTGGRFFHNSNDLDRGFRELGSVPEITYLLGFAPDEVPDNKYHKLSVQLTGKTKHSLQSRPGYMAVKEAPPPARRERTIDKLVFQTTAIQDAPIGISSRVAAQTDGKPALETRFRIDIEKVPFLSQASIRTATIQCLVAILDDQGSFITGKELAMEFALKPETFAKLSETGLDVVIPLEAAPGNYRLRAVAEDVNGGLLTTVFHPFTIP